jgi:hypothetical protein
MPRAKCLSLAELPRQALRWAAELAVPSPTSYSLWPRRRGPHRQPSILRCDVRLVLDDEGPSRRKIRRPHPGSNDLRPSSRGTLPNAGPRGLPFQLSLGRPPAGAFHDLDHRSAGHTGVFEQRIHSGLDLGWWAAIGGYPGLKANLITLAGYCEA